MRNLKLFLIASVLLTCLQAGPTEQEKYPVPSIELYPVRLTLGMPREKVISMLAEHYDVYSSSPWIGPDHTWSVAEKTKLKSVVASIRFDNDKLVQVVRPWPHEYSEYSAFHTLASVLSRLREEGFAICDLTIQRGTYPKGEAEFLHVNCGPKGAIVIAERSQYELGRSAESVEILENMEGIVVPRPR